MIQRSTGEAIVCADTPRDPLSPVYLEPERPSIFKAVLADWSCLDDAGNFIPVPEYIPGKPIGPREYRYTFSHLGWVLVIYSLYDARQFSQSRMVTRQARKAKAALSNMLRFPWASQKYKKWARVLDRYVTYMSAPRHPVKLERIVSPKFAEGVQMPGVDIREILCRNPILERSLE